MPSTHTIEDKPPESNAIDIVRNARLLAIAIFLLQFGYGAYLAANMNFAVQALHLSPLQLGYVESIRELPGLMMVFIAALTMRVSEPLLATFSLILVSIGLGAYYTVDSFPPLVAFSLVWSIGLHTWMTVQPSIAMALAEENQKGRRLGQFNAVAAVGTICGMGLVLWKGDVLGFHRIFLMAGIIIGIGAISSSFISRDIGQAKKPRLVFKPAYKKYYILTFLEGCRKQVFMTFAIYALVKNYGTPMQTVALLMIINNVANILFAPAVGKIVDRIGERKVLVFCYTLLVFVFIGYATIRIPHVLYLLYCMDSLLYLGSIGLTTYIQKISDPKDLMPTLAMGVSMNHGAAVMVPLVGALLWNRLGYQATFFGGAVIVIISIIFANSIRIPSLSTMDSRESALAEDS